MILGIDTATPSTAVAVWAPDGPALERRDDPRRGPAARPRPAAARARRGRARGGRSAAGRTIERIAVGVGPGGFTGLRLGIATARALAQARDLPLVGVSSLAALAAGARDAAAGRTVLAAIDARRGEVFAAAWRDGEPVLEPVAIAPADLAARLGAGTLTAPLAVGDGAVRYAGELATGGRGRPGGRRAGASRQRAAGVPARRRGGARGTRRPAPRLPARTRRQAAQTAVTAPPASAVEIRRLTYADLPQVVAIERRSFTTPWSLAMFVLELSKPSGICLAAEVVEDDARELVGYLICSRYDTVWHVMNVVGRPRPPPPRDRVGAARRADRAHRRGRGPGLRPDHARGAPLERGRDRALRALRVPLGRRPAALLPGQRGGRRDHVAHPGHPAGLARRRPRLRMILAIETSCDDTCAAVVTADGRGALQRRLLPGRARALRRGRARDRLAPPPRARQRGRRRRARARAGTDLDDIETVAVTQGPGLVGALLVGVATAKAIAAARRLPLAAVDHLQGHVAANFLAPAPIEPPFTCLIASGGHTLLARVHDHAGYELLGQTLDDAAGEAFDKGARLLGLGYPGGPALSKLALTGRPAARSPSPPAARVAGLDFSFAGLKTALLYTMRDLGPEATARARRRPRRLLRARDRRGADDPRRARARRRPGPAAGDRRRRRRQPAAARARRRARRAGPRPAARAVHRQRGDDRLRRALGRRRSRSRATSTSTPTPPPREDRHAVRPRRAAICATTRAPSSSASAPRQPFALEVVDIEQRRRPCTRATWSGSPWSRSTARSCSTSSSTRRALLARLRGSIVSAR